MAVLLGLDAGTTTLTALAMDSITGAVLAQATVANEGRLAAAPGRSEWCADTAFECAVAALAQVTAAVGDRTPAGLGLTGQQHGVVVIDRAHRALTPFVNWQDRRLEEPTPDGTSTWLERALGRLDPDAPRRCGCRLATGYLAATLFWCREHEALPPGTACFLPDYLGARLTAAEPVTDPTQAAAGGCFDQTLGAWDQPVLSALGLSPAGLPRVAQAGDPLGALSAAAAAATGLPAGLPVTIGLGDNQAGFIGSVAEREATVLVNVGTGAQVGRFTAQPLSAPEAELRPYPRGGALLVHAGLCGGRSYAALEAFFRAVGHELLGQADPGPLYEAMNRLARTVPPGASDLRCEPYFAGSRSDPDRRASWTGLSELNFTPAHFVRSLLEGMAVSLRAGAAGIDLALGRPATKLVGAGNGLRENPVLAEIVSQAFELPLAVPAHREEAAYGAALSAGVGLGIWPDLAAAGQVIRYVAA